MIAPTSPFISFENDAHKLEMLKHWGIVAREAKTIKPLYYKGFYSSEFVPCDVVGFSDDTLIVISLLGALHCINPDYLAEMQPSEAERKSLNRYCALAEHPRRQKGNSIVCFPPDCVIVDVETTGLDSSSDSIIEFAAMRIRNNDVVSRFSSLINPGRPVSAFISELTGITNDMLSSAPLMPLVAQKIRDFIGDDLIVGHNVNFDINFLCDALNGAASAALTNDYVDTLRISRKLFPGLAHHRLSDVASALGVSQASAHRAMGDCETTYRCLLALKKAVLARTTESEFISRFSANIATCSYSQYDLRNISAMSIPANPSHPFYGKNCVFSGELVNFTRQEAAQLVADFGGVLQNDVTKKTNYLILGNNEYNPLVKGGISRKQKKAESYILAGCDLQIISETVFLSMISDTE